MSGGFEDLGLLPELVRATQDMGWVLPSDVQDEAIPLILGGGDVMVAAETGSGKTGAFALPAIQIVHEVRRGMGERKPAAGAGQESEAPSAGPAAKRARVEETVKLNPNDRSPMLAIAPEGFTCQCRQERDWGGVRATKGVLIGKYFYEASINDDGLCRFGWSTQAASLDLGTDRNGFGFGGTGKKSNDKSFEAYGETFGKGDTIGCFIELSPTSNSVSFSKNGKSLGTAFTVTKITGGVFPAICMKNAECSVNFGSSPFKFPPTDDSGFVGVQMAPSEVCVSGPDPSAKAVSSNPDNIPVGPVCLILEPGRDLAEQTHKAIEQMRKYVSSPSINHALIIGGVESRESNRQLSRVPDIITATPGKLVDLLDTGKINTSQIRLFILDEADKFTDEENTKLINKIYAKIRTSIDLAGGTGSGRLQVCFFSATLHSPEIGAMSDRLCKTPTWVDLKGKDSVPDTVHHVVIPVDAESDRSWMKKGTTSDVTLQTMTDGVHAHDRISAVADKSSLSGEEVSEGIKRLKQRMLLSLIDSLRMDQCIIFCRTNLDCDNLEAYLTAVGGGTKFRAGMEKGRENPYSAVVLAGMRSMEERRRNLAAFKAGDVRFLVCTDVAARGLDIKELPYVVNMSLPDDIENYIHRIGRVGRADRMGLAISLVATKQEKVWYHVCKDRGKGCHNTRLKEAGGCTVWYDEPALLKATTKRLGIESVPAMRCAANAIGPSDTVLPYVFTLPEGFSDGVVYGEERGDKAAANVHVEAIRDQVSSLATLEMRAQTAFLSLALKYRTKVGASGAT